MYVYKNNAQHGSLYINIKKCQNYPFFLATYIALYLPKYTIQKSHEIKLMIL